MTTIVGVILRITSDLILSPTYSTLRYLFPAVFSPAIDSAPCEISFYGHAENAPHPSPVRSGRGGIRQGNGKKDRVIMLNIIGKSGVL
jgi:hypothetical protein